MKGRIPCLPNRQVGEGDHPKGGGGVADEACSNYPSTTILVVPLPIADGEANR
jgi:hypothetical protein